MHLRSYFEAERGRIARLAEAQAVSASLVTQWARGKTVPAERCAAIERLTGRQVMRWDLRPDDWHQIWPELVGLTDPPAPAVNAEAFAPAEAA